MKRLLQSHDGGALFPPLPASPPKWIPDAVLGWRCSAEQMLGTVMGRVPGPRLLPQPPPWQAGASCQQHSLHAPHGWGQGAFLSVHTL